MKRPYDTAFARASSSGHCAALTLPPELWFEVMKHLSPTSPVKHVRYAEGPHPWSTLASLARCCHFLNQLASDVLYEQEAPFVFDVAAEDSLPLFLIRLSDIHIVRIKSVEINYTGHYQVRDISVGLDLLLKCTSLQSLKIVGLPGHLSLQRILICFRLQSFEPRYYIQNAKSPQMRDETLDRMTSSEARTRKEQRRVDESKVDKVSTFPQCLRMVVHSASAETIQARSVCILYSITFTRRTYDRGPRLKSKLRRKKLWQHVRAITEHSAWRVSCVHAHRVWYR